MAIVDKYFGCVDLRRGLMRYSTALMILGTLSLLFSLFDTQNRYDVDEEEAHAQMLIYAGSHTLFILLNAGLLLGTYKESPAFLLPYIVIKAIALALVTVASFVLVYAYPVLIVVILLSALQWYIWICVLSYYQILTSNPTYVTGNSDKDRVINVDCQPPPYEKVYTV